MSQPEEIKVEEILHQAEIYDEVRLQWDMLSRIVKVIKSQGLMDKDTIIYRLAMTIYHATSLTNRSLIPSLDDPSSIYLKIQDNPRLKAIIEEMSKDYKIVPIVELVRTFMCFIIAAYIYESTS